MRPNTTKQKLREGRTVMGAIVRSLSLAQRNISTSNANPSTLRTGSIAIVDVNDGKMKAVAEEVRAIGRKATTFKVIVPPKALVKAA